MGRELLEGDFGGGGGASFAGKKQDQQIRPKNSGPNKTQNAILNPPEKGPQKSIKMSKKPAFGHLNSPKPAFWPS